MDNTDIIHNYGEDVFVDLCFPACDDKLKPHVGQIFPSLDEGYKFYKIYAATCGFQSRLSTLVRARDGTVRTRYVVCNREGMRDKPADPLLIPETSVQSQKRKRPSCRIHCIARIVLEISSGGFYKIRTFNEGHNHTMIPHQSRHFMTTNRNVDELHQMFIFTGMKANIGLMRTFRFYKELVGGYDSVGCTINDFKNFARDLRVYRSGSDAHMLLEEFKDKQQNSNVFKYYYDVHDDNRLRRLFWEDEISIKNFSLFGDAVSFDATYNTNRYKLIFTPFTGRDNHGKCVTFGAAIISREDMEAYSWVLEKFRESMGSTPNVLITDQDPGLRKAVASVWPSTSHRFCMWHITMKLAEKLPVRLRADSDFKTKFGNIVWSDHDEPAEFEDKWLKLMVEYELTDSRWFCDMFNDRSFWIPAYFRDINMSGLFRTTSLSESENSFFRRFLNKNCDLLLLYMNYCSAIDAQRHAFHKMTHADESCCPVFVTKLGLERHASTIYTLTIFKEVQQEIESALADCAMSKMFIEGEDTVYVVDDNIDGTFEVRFQTENDYLSCSCTLFIRKGLLCRHMLLVMRSRKIERIPDKYIVPRWTKLSRLTPQVGQLLGLDVSSQHAPPGNSRFYALLAKTLGYVNGNQKLNDQLYSALLEVSLTFSKLGEQCESSNTRLNAFEQFFGQAIPDVPSVLPPQITKTKGSGVGGRRKSNAEKAIILANKPMRTCRKCNRKGHHDSRNCPGKDVADT